MLVDFDSRLRAFRATRVDPAFLPTLRDEYGWDINDGYGVYTQNPALVTPFYGSCSPEAKQQVYPYAWHYAASFTDRPILLGTEGYVPFPESKVPFPFQYGGIHLLAQRKHALLADQPGLGKTMQAIGIANIFRPRRVLIAMPTFLVQTWADELAQFAAYSMPIQKLDRPNRAIAPSGFILLPYSRAVQYESQLRASGHFDYLVMDEAHFLKGGYDTKRIRPFFGSKEPGCEPLPGLVHLSHRSLAITGTPMPNQPGELWNFLYCMAPHILRGRSRDKFTEDHVRRDFMGRIEGAYRAEALNVELRATGFMVRRLKDTVLTQLPPKQINFLHMPCDSKIESLVREEAGLYEQSQFAPQTAASLANLVGHIMRVRKLLALAKVPRIVEYADIVLNGGENRLVIFMLHIEAIDMIAEMLQKKGVVVFPVTGRVNFKKRDEMRKVFQSADPRKIVWLGQIRASGVGLTLTKAARAGMGEVSWSPADNEQAMDRIHRISQTRHVDIDILTFPHSVEGSVIRANGRKALMATAVLDTRLTSALVDAENALVVPVVDDEDEQGD